MAEMKEKADRHKFHGGVIDVSYESYAQHVDAIPEGSKGVIHMYQDYVPESALLKAIWPELARRHPHVKWMQIQADKCAKGFNDKDVPCLLFYSGREDGTASDLVENISGQQCKDVFGGKKMNVDTVEFVLATHHKIIEKKFEDDPRDALKTFNAFVVRKKGFLGKDGD